MDLPPGLWVRVARFSHPSSLATLLQAAPRLQLELEGMVLTHVRCVWDYGVFFVHDGGHSVLPFAAITLSMFGGHRIRAGMPWAKNVTHLNVSWGDDDTPISIPNVALPNVVSVRFQLCGGRAGVIEKGVFSERVTSVEFTDERRTGFSYRGELMSANWFPPALDTLRGVTVSKRLFDRFPTLFPTTLRELAIHVTSSPTDPPIPLAFLRNLEVLHITGTCRLDRTHLPPRLRKLTCPDLHGSALHFLARPVTIFPITLVTLVIGRVTPDVTLTPGSFPSRLEELGLVVDRIPRDVFPTSLKKLKVGCSTNKMVVRVGDIPPHLESLEFQNKVRAFYIMVETGALPPSIVHFSSSNPVMFSNSVEKYESGENGSLEYPMPDFFSEP